MDRSRRRMLGGLAGMLSAAGVRGRGPALPPDFGPNVILLDPAMSGAAMQARLDAVFRAQERAHWTDRRYAVLLKPGRYALDVNVGFFTQIAGLGLLPDDVTIAGRVHVEADWMNGTALDNFWRSAENLAVIPPDGRDRWAVSQAAPYRRMHLHGDLALDDGGWASGGFMADCRIEGTVRSGTQQQWYSRASALSGWEGANWNMMFQGTAGAPPTGFPEPPITNEPDVPLIREKPFLCLSPQGAWQVFVPALRRAAIGPSWGAEAAAGVGIPLHRFLIARPSTPPSAINAALARGRHLLLTPGIYRMAEPLRIVRPGTVVLGLGIATLLPTAGGAAIEIADVGDVTVAGLLIDAGPRPSPVLVRVGPRGASGDHRASPVLLADVFFRVGGAAIGCAGTCLEINSRGTIGDHLWIWRADHGDREGGRIHTGWTESMAAHGLVVNAHDVTLYGLFVEHFQGAQVWWRGERGRTFFFQSELPYDPPSRSAWRADSDRGWAAYTVEDRVRTHRAVGLGIYANFTADPSITLASAVEVPRTPDVRIENVTTVSLGGGKGVIAHLVNDRGLAARPGAIRQTLRRYP